MKTPIAIIATALIAISASADEGTFIYITNKAGIVKRVQVPPAPPVLVPVNRNPLNRATFPPEPKPKPPHKPGFELRTKDPIALMFIRGRLIDRQDVLIAKYPNEEQFKLDREALIKALDAAMAEGVKTCLTNEAKRTEYRAAVRFWNENHIANNVVVRTPPPDSKVYLTPSIE